MKYKNSSHNNNHKHGNHPTKKDAAATASSYFGGVRFVSQSMKFMSSRSIEQQYKALKQQQPGNPMRSSSSPSSTATTSPLLPPKRPRLAKIIRTPSHIGDDDNDDELEEEALRITNPQKGKNRTTIIYPWSPSYKQWWIVTVIGSLLSGFTIVYSIAFVNVNHIYDAFHILEFIFILLFTIDIGINFHLSYYNDQNILIVSPKQIQRHYFQTMFVIDVLGILPLDILFIAIAKNYYHFNDDGEEHQVLLLLSLLRLLRLVRLHRLGPLNGILQYSTNISLISFTLIRNFAVALAVTHFSACTMYYLARLQKFNIQTTWLGQHLYNEYQLKVLDGSGDTTSSMNHNAMEENYNQYSQEYNTNFERYTTSLYWSIVTFATVGYGDFSPVNSLEKIWGMFFMLCNIVVSSWIIGSITLLVVKGDEKSGNYRDSLETLESYTRMNELDAEFQKKLKTQLRLEFNNREISDECVLKNFPNTIRRKVLRKLYLDLLVNTNLMKHVRQQFIDAFLASCNIEIFSPGEEIVERGSISSDLFLLVGGVAEVILQEKDTNGSSSNSGNNTKGYSTFEDSDEDENTSSSSSWNRKQINAGNFIGEIGFFTESPQIHSVCCLTVCKTLTMSSTTYKLIAQDHPSSVGKILQNLLTKVQEKELKLSLPRSLSLLRAGSAFDDKSTSPSSSSSSHNGTAQNDDCTRRKRRQEAALTSIQELVKMHMSKQKDDQTTRLLFAASRGDTETISLMCDQGFDPNNADYDNRTALMVASMKGNTDVVWLLLVEYDANPNLLDMHGSSALYEAVKNGHDATIQLLLKNGAQLCMKESLAASILCQAVYDGDVPFLRRLLQAGIEVNACDYDMRSAAHIAAAEGNTLALKGLVEYGANLSLKDRWDNSIHDEAVRANATQTLKYINSIHSAEEQR